MAPRVPAPAPTHPPRLHPPSTPQADHAYWGRPEDDAQARPAYTWDASKPASDAAGAAAAALAATALAVRPSDPAYAARCLDHARRLFAFASKVRAGGVGWAGERRLAAGAVGKQERRVPGRLAPPPPAAHHHPPPARPPALPQHEGKYSDSQPSVTYVYASSSFVDDLAYSAAWLFRATGEQSYLSAARGYLKRAQVRDWVGWAVGGSVGWG